MLHVFCTIPFCHCVFTYGKPILPSSCLLNHFHWASVDPHLATIRWTDISLFSIRHEHCNYMWVGFMKLCGMIDKVVFLNSRKVIIVHPCLHIAGFLLCSVHFVCCRLWMRQLCDSWNFFSSRLFVPFVKVCCGFLFKCMLFDQSKKRYKVWTVKWDRIMGRAP